jgi:hypothetical protein
VILKNLEILEILLNFKSFNNENKEDEMQNNFIENNNEDSKNYFPINFSNKYCLERRNWRIL